MVNEENENAANGKSINLKNFPTFELEDDFVVFKEKLENVFEILHIGEDQKSGILIAIIGTQVYKILKNLCSPVKPKEKSYADLTSLLDKQFIPNVLPYKERRTFYEARQLQGETIINWNLRIKSLAVNCEFGERLNDILKDQFISGLQKGKFFDKICEEEWTVSYENILKIALIKESSLN